MIRRIVIGVAIVMWIAIIAIAFLFFTGAGGRVLAGALPVGGVAPVAFATLALATTPNQYLVCPEDLCAAPTDATAPAFDIPIDALRDRWQAMASAEPSVTLLGESNDGWQFDYVQRTAYWRFPDIITVRFIEPEPGRSTLAVYSRAVYGHSDLGLNKARIEAWLAKLGG